MSEELKKCRFCNQFKPISSFRLQQKRFRGQQCKDCMRKQSAIRKLRIQSSPPKVPPNNEKSCLDCKQIKPLTEFAKNINHIDHRGPRCKKCDRKKQFIRHLHYNYKMTYQDYKSMYHQQGKGCKLCGKKRDEVLTHRYRPLDVDHSHSTGKPRALLCNPCNCAIAQIEYLQENNLLQKALDYLNSHTSNPVQNTV